MILFYRSLVLILSGCLFFKKIWIIPQRLQRRLPNPSPNSSPTAKLQVPVNQGHIDPSRLLLLIFVGVPQGHMPTRTHRKGRLRGDCPLRSWKILYFWNWNRAIWWKHFSANLEQATSKKKKIMNLTDPNFAFWEKFWLKILQESLKIWIFFFL